jgi:nucleoside-diphosphate-sugar epimerase
MPIDIQDKNPADFMDARILVTGGSGFIGSLLCRRLIGQGASVHAISRRSGDVTANEVKWWQGDLAHPETVAKLFAQINPDIVFHLASEVTGSRDLQLVQPTLQGNLLSAVNILSAATKQGVKRIVMAGSLEEPDETDAATAIPCSPYAAAKWASSSYTRMFHVLYQTPATLARLFMVYGPGQKDLRKIIPYVTLSLLRGDAPKLSSGQRPIDWIHVEDVVSGLSALAISRDVEGRTFDLGSGELTTTRQVVEILCEIIGAGIKPEFGAIPDRPMERIKKANTEHAKRVLGWSPALSLQQGLEQTVNWFRNRLESGELHS